MYHYTNSWNLLETDYLDSDTLYSYYKAFTPSLSPFAIGVRPVIEPVIAIEEVDAGYCGDGICQPGESCNSCPIDCGECPVTIETDELIEEELDFADEDIPVKATKTGWVYWLIFIFIGLIASGVVVYFVFVRGKEEMFLSMLPGKKSGQQTIKKTTTPRTAAEPPELPKPLEPADQSDELIDYVRDMLNKGYPASSIKKALMGSGWTKSEIENAFNALNKTSGKKE